MNLRNNLVLIGGAIIFKDYRGKRTFLLVKPEAESEWEIPKITVRKGESSVRAVIRMTGELAGMNAKVLEEAARGTGATTINGRLISQKYYYYLMMLKAGGSEALGFMDHKWFEYTKASKLVTLKREKDALKGAKEVLKEWEKIHNKK